MNLPFKKVLVLSPHTDDGELGCGGLISRFISENAIIKFIAFSDCKPSIPDHLPKDILQKEMTTSMNNLGISDYELLDYPVRNFDLHRQEILDQLIKIKLEYQPDFILTPSTNDVHQDHQVITNECIRAFKMSTILGYELPWNQFSLPSNCIISISRKELEKKIESILCYKSQDHRKYVSRNFIEALALTRGARINKDLAEAFEIIRLIL